jgi:arabinofuranosyltransferase
MQAKLANDWKELIHDVLCASLVTVTMSGLSYVLLEPKIGIDDANITQVYAQRLVSGEGFRFNVGGETVEGSTSLLWTLLLVPFFFVSDRPEAAIAAFCRLLATGTVALTLRLSRTLAPILEVSPRAAAIGAAGAFTLFPPFFLWSLDDVRNWQVPVGLDNGFAGLALRDRSSVPIIRRGAGSLNFRP